MSRASGMETSLKSTSSAPPAGAAPLPFFSMGASCTSTTTLSSLAPRWIRHGLVVCTAGHNEAHHWQIRWCRQRPCLNHSPMKKRERNACDAVQCMPQRARQLKNGLNDRWGESRRLQLQPNQHALTCSQKHIDSCTSAAPMPVPRSPRYRKPLLHALQRSAIHAISQSQ